MRNKFWDKVTGQNRWKTLIFALGVLMIIGAITYSLVLRQANSTGNSPNNGTAQTVANSAASAPGSGSIGDLNWVKNLNTRFVDNDLMFIVLPGSNDSTKMIYQEIERAVAKIMPDGVRIDTLTLNSDDPELSITAQRLSIGKLPAVIALSNSGSGAIVSGEITETKLLQAYLTAYKACAPGSSSGCCP